REHVVLNATGRDPAHVKGDVRHALEFAQEIRKRLSHDCGQIPSNAAQFEQQILPIETDRLSEYRGCDLSAQIKHYAWLRDHDPRRAECAEALARLLSQRRLDRRLYRGVEFRHGRDLADDAAEYADRDRTVSDSHTSASVTQF